jgi:hypothetical protein
MCLLPMEKREMLCTRQLYNKEYKKILKQISYIKYQSRNEKNLSYYRDLQRVLPLVDDKHERKKNEGKEKSITYI